MDANQQRKGAMKEIGMIKVAAPNMACKVIDAGRFRRTVAAVCPTISGLRMPMLLRAIRIARQPG